MNASNLMVNCAMRLRSSSNPKLMLGRESATDGASADESGGRIPLVESDGSKVAMISGVSESVVFYSEVGLTVNELWLEIECCSCELTWLSLEECVMPLRRNQSCANPKLVSF